MTDFLLELRSEEIPARMQLKAADDLARLFADELAKSGLKAEKVETLVTPRRLTLIARGLPVETQSVSEERKGPRANAPEQALAGFLRSTGLTREQLIDRDGVFFAIIEKPGRPTAAVLAEAIPAIVRAFPWPKSMRWGAASLSTESLKWVRPLQGIVALFGETIVPFEIDGIQSGATTLGHRFHHSGPITIGSAEDYAEKLRMCHVIVDHSERMAVIRDGAVAAALAAGLTMVPDEGLIAENAGLTEWPVPLLGRFDPEFLTVPREVIQLTMRTNQKYFACTDANGALANAFICTANIEASDGGAGIVAGNQKVLAARLSDAKFFWEQDLKVPLEEQAKKLSQIVFHEKLGTVADKVDRVAKLARWLVTEGIVTSSPLPLAGGVGGGPESQPTEVSPTPSPSRERAGDTLADMAETAAHLCKADLVTGMVGEFPELQGIMGGYYAEAQGHELQIANAIRDHYKPVGQGDDVPTAPVTVAVSLADKLDTLVSFFIVKERPTGSKDPFALRRAILSILTLIEVNGLRTSFADLVQKAGDFVIWWKQLETMDDKRFAEVSRSELWRDMLAESHQVLFEYDDSKNYFVRIGSQPMMMSNSRSSGNVPDIADRALVLDQISDFFADRLKVQQREAGIRHDLIDAVFALGGEDDLVRLLARVKALQAFVTTPEGANLLSGYKRASNILKKSPSPLAGEGGALAPGEGPAASAAENPLSSEPLTPLAGGESPSPAGGEGLGYTPEPAEQSLVDALDAAEPLATAAIAREDFEAAMSALASLRAPIDAFFEAVTVNDADPVKRDTRLKLLARVRDAVHRVADFSKIEG
ncbi:MAG: glycine--tRNA ligase subunit beta [Sphingomonadales bacterium]|nr:glycine--tRNA ligase subunit beta [Sphingomonadales bacterium]